MTSVPDHGMSEARRLAMNPKNGVPPTSPTAGYRGQGRADNAPAAQGFGTGSLGKTHGRPVRNALLGLQM